MVYITLRFYLFLVIVLLLYYCLPINRRWIALLGANCYFYYVFYKTGWWIVLGTGVVSFIFSWLFVKEVNHPKVRKTLLALSIIIIIIPWFLAKDSTFVFGTAFSENPLHVIIPLGISFYTMECISYLVDVYTEKTLPEKNIFKFILFLTFFPKLVQGPISRYNQLAAQLSEGRIFDENKVVKGFYHIIWGFFLKLVIADKAGIIVDRVFDNFPAYTGIYIWVASFLYSIQLYTDFLACTTLAQGIAYLFGIELSNNFMHPYFSKSVKEFWRRWHISLSSWLKDYVYIPLGGSRKGTFRKYLNLIITFIVSGIWHGAGYNYIFWGLMHAGFQIMESVIKPPKLLMKFKGKSFEQSVLSTTQTIITFLLVNFAWIIFRGSSLITGLKMIKHMFSEFNPWILFNDRIFTIGLSWKECLVLIMAIVLLFKVSLYQEKNGNISEKILSKGLLIRWTICILGILGIVVFGTYGYGYNAQDFIYGGF